MQRVEVRYENGAGGYAYGWRGEPLKVGDLVEVPGPYWGDGKPQPATVSKVTTEYEGTVSYIIRKVQK